MYGFSVNAFHFQDIFLNFSTILEWIKDNWYWLLVGFAGISEFK